MHSYLARSREDDYVNSHKSVDHGIAACPKFQLHLSVRCKGFVELLLACMNHAVSEWLVHDGPWQLAASDMRRCS